MDDTGRVHGVILAGGRGVRLWPLSRESRGKQFLPLVGERSLLRRTAERLGPLTGWERLLVVLEESQLAAARRELPELTPQQFLVEPARRNTAPAVALAAVALAARDPAAVMVVAPADHEVTEPQVFRTILAAAVAAATGGGLVTVGIRPTRPETGYGYIEVGPAERIENEVPIHRALAFVEKPPQETAQRLVDSGRYLWNSGMFVWTVSAISAALDRHLPALQASLAGIPLADLMSCGEALRRAYREIEPVSVDYGIMEKAETLLVVPGSFGWNDVGNWRALDDLWPADRDGNRARGDFLAVSSRGVTVYGGERLVAAVGLHDLVIIDAPDALLVCSKEKAQEVREVVARLAAEGREDLL